MANKIGIIGVYFGTVPKYFSAWLESCRSNPTVDFLLFTDQNLDDVPPNVKIYAMTLDKMRKLASQELGFDAFLDRPYKCCDYKVIYGLIFKEHVAQYDYWGCCDFDLIFGDLQAFFDQYDLYKYDRFLALGHLCLYRNTEDVNQRYRCEGGRYDYTTVYTTAKICGFDEYAGMIRIYQKNGFSTFTKRVFVDIATLYHRYRVGEAYSLDARATNYKYQIFYWEKGKIYRAYYLKGKIEKEEYMYIHFQKRPNYELSFDCAKADAFYITNRGFIEKKGEVTLTDIKKMNPYPGAIYERVESFIIPKRRKVIRFLKRKKNRG